MRTLLVTGGAGFIGGNYVLRSLAQDDDLRIVNLDALTYAGNLDTLQSLGGEEAGSVRSRASTSNRSCRGVEWAVCCSH